MIEIVETDGVIEIVETELSGVKEEGNQGHGQVLAKYLKYICQTDDDKGVVSGYFLDKSLT